MNPSKLLSSTASVALLGAAAIIPRTMFGPGPRRPGEVRVAFEGEGGGGGGGGGQIDPNDPVIKALIDKAVSEATAGLKKNRDDLLGEKKKLDDQLKAFLDTVGGEDGLQRLRAMRENLEKDELGKLLAEGKHDEWLERRTDAMKTAHSKELDARDKRIAELETEATDAKTKLRTHIINSAITAACTEVAVKPAYGEAVKALIRNRVDIGEDGDFVVYDEDTKTIKYGPKGKPASVAELIDSLREKMPDIFEASSGGGASGSGRSGGHSGPNPWRKGAEFNVTEQGRITRDNPELAKRLKAEASAA